MWVGENEIKWEGQAYWNMIVQLLTLRTIPWNARWVVTQKPKLKRLQRHEKERENLASLTPMLSHSPPDINYSQRSMPVRAVLVSHCHVYHIFPPWVVGRRLWRRFIKPLSFYVLWLISCQSRTEDVLKMTVSLWKMTLWRGILCSW